MAFPGLTAEDLQLSRERLTELFAPFVDRRFEARDPEWLRMLTRRNRKIGRKLLKRRLLGWIPRHRRTPAEVHSEYGPKWMQKTFESYDPSAPRSHSSMYEWGSERMLAGNRGGKRLRQLVMMRVIEWAKPRTVLEVGCGNGINLLILAARFPEVGFSGIELTPAGVAAARRAQELPELPGALREFSPLPLVDVTAHRRIQFHEGSAERMPFAPGSFDLVLTSTALEQMENMRERALREVTRVAGSHVLLIEPFRDVNDAGLPRRYVLARDYFRGRIEDLSQYGLQVLFVTSDFPQKVNLKFAAVVAAKV
jgi:SAM-dependent methyltransferase